MTYPPEDYYNSPEERANRRRSARAFLIFMGVIAALMIVLS